VTNRFARAASRLEARLGGYAAVDIVYSRQLAVGDQDPPAGGGNITVSDVDANGNVVVSIATTASVGRSPFESQTDSGLTITDEHRDYLVLAADLATFWPVAGGNSEPMAGDQVREVLNGATAIFEAMSPGNQPVFTRPGSAGSQFRIHTKRTGTE